MVQGLRLPASNAGAWVQSLARQVLHAAWCGPPPPKKATAVGDNMDGPWKWKWKSLGCVWLFVTPWNSMEFSSQNTRACSFSLLQGIFPTQGLNPGLPHCRWILYQLSHQGGPRILEWVAYPFSSGSSRPRTRTGVSWITDGFFTNWALREAKGNKSDRER